MQPKSIAIPISYKEIMCRYNFAIRTTTTVNVEIKKLEDLTVGQKLMSELFLVYEGKDSSFYYFHAEAETNWVDNNGFVYAR
ncbi:MAG: hypothetical protein ACRC1P_08880 [Cellulosilyticaceae bacterium]